MALGPQQASSPLLEAGRGAASPLPRSDVELAAAFGLDRRAGRERLARQRSALVQDRDAGSTSPGLNPGVCYLLYCVVCLALTIALLVVTAGESFAPSREARFWRRRLRPWEEAAEAFVGAALCTETLGLLWVIGWRRFFRDRWRTLDAAVAGLTLVCGAFFMLRRAVRHAGDVVEDIDMPILGLRFALQPIRMFSTASMVVRAHRLHLVAAQAPAEPPPLEDPRRPCAALTKPVLTPQLAAQLRELLPCYLRYVQWELAYSPRVHGTSISTFYRRQAGPNILVVRDAHGGLFGGFATEPWRPTAGAYGSGEAFVFVAHGAPAPSGEPAAAGQEAADPAAASSAEASTAGRCGAAPAGCADEQAGSSSSSSSSGRLQCLPREARAIALQPMPPGRPAQREPEARLEVFWAMPRGGRVIQWSDSKMLGLGHAVVLCDDFLRGSSSVCEAFGSAPLSPAGNEFIIRDFECWHVGLGTGEDLGG